MLPRLHEEVRGGGKPPVAHRLVERGDISQPYVDQRADLVIRGVPAGWWRIEHDAPNGVLRKAMAVLGCRELESVGRRGAHGYLSQVVLEGEHEAAHRRAGSRCYRPRTPAQAHRAAQDA